MGKQQCVHVGQALVVDALLAHSQQATVYQTLSKYFPAGKLEDICVSFAPLQQASTRYSKV